MSHVMAKCNKKIHVIYINKTTDKDVAMLDQAV